MVKKAFTTTGILSTEKRDEILLRLNIQLDELVKQ